VAPGRLGHVDYGHGAVAGRDDRTIGDPDPLAAIRPEELIANGPVSGLVRPPFGVNLGGDLRGEAICKAIHRCTLGWTASDILSPIPVQFWFGMHRPF
jgi:hypothetical protein